MYKYCKDMEGNISEVCIKRILDGAIIPFDLANTDYQEYLKWLEEGNTPLPAEENN